MSVATAARPVERMTRVVLRAEPGAWPEEELRLLAAIEEFARSNERLRLEYGTENPDIYALLRGAWFLRERWEYSLPAEWEARVAGDVGVTLPEPDPLEAAEAERHLYNGWHAAETAKVKAQQENILKMGMKDLVLPLPDHQFQPRWNKGHGYLWALGDYLGVPVPFPDEPLRPHGYVPGLVASPYRQQFRKARFLDKPFLVYDFRLQPDPLALLRALQQAAPQVNLISIVEVERAADLTPAALLTLFSDRNAMYVVAPAGLVSTTAWAAGVDNLIELYDGANIAWDGALARNSSRIDMQRTPAAEVPAYLIQALQLIEARVREGVR